VQSGLADEAIDRRLKKVEKQMERDQNAEQWKRLRKANEEKGRQRRSEKDKRFDPMQMYRLTRARNSGS
jgi:hypothetical protein